MAIKVKTQAGDLRGEYIRERDIFTKKRKSPKLLLFALLLVVIAGYFYYLNLGSPLSINPSTITGAKQASDSVDIPVDTSADISASARIEDTKKTDLGQQAQLITAVVTDEQTEAVELTEIGRLEIDNIEFDNIKIDKTDQAITQDRVELEQTVAVQIPVNEAADTSAEIAGQDSVTYAGIDNESHAHAAEESNSGSSIDAVSTMIPTVFANSAEQEDQVEDVVEIEFGRTANPQPMEQKVAIITSAAPVEPEYQGSSVEELSELNYEAIDNVTLDVAEVTAFEMAESDGDNEDLLRHQQQMLKNNLDLDRLLNDASVFEGVDSIAVNVLDNSKPKKSLNPDDTTPEITANVKTIEVVAARNETAQQEQIPAPTAAVIEQAVETRAVELDAVNTELIDNRGSTPLIIAVLNADEQAVRELVQQGARVNARNDWGWTALLNAITRGNRPMVEYLLNNGASPHLADNSGRSPLMTAVLNNHPEIVKILLDHNADVNKADQNGWTALSFAAWKGDAASVRYLLQANAFKQYRNNEGHTAIQLARQGDHTEIIKLLRR